jgi:glycosyltransferase involved in cell wall biosynthesis
MLDKKVSILIPAYKPNWLDKAIMSALQQNYGNIEIIVTDDCPTDAVGDVVSRYSNRIRYFKNADRDGRGYNNIVRALSLATGEYIKFLFDDDLLHADCCSVLAGGLDSNAACSLAFSARHVINEQDCDVGSFRFKDTTEYIDSKTTIRQMALSCTNFIGEPSTVLFRRSDYLAMGPEGLFGLRNKPARALIDVALFANLAGRGDYFFFSDRLLSSFRRSSLQNSQSNRGVLRFAVSEWMDLLSESVRNDLVSKKEAIIAASRFREKSMRYYRNDPEMQAVVIASTEEFNDLQSENSRDHASRRCYRCRALVPRFLPYRGGEKSISPVMRALRVIGSDVENYMCPSCRCNDRLRHLMMYMDKLNIWSAVPGADLLHVSPECELEAMLSELSPASYRRIDLLPSRPGIEKMDLQALELRDESISIVICNHVLEHVSDAERALSEIARVLRPGGIAILQTPWSPILRKTLDADVDSDAERELLFGQADHVRLFGLDLFDYIARSGMIPMRVRHDDVLSEYNCAEFGVNPHEEFLVAVKMEGQTHG